MVSEKDIRYVAALSRISLREKEVDNLTKDMEQILNYIEKLKCLDISNVTPTTHVLPLKNVYREDVVTPSLSVKEAIAISVEQKEGFFKVPKVIE